MGYRLIKWLVSGSLGKSRSRDGTEAPVCWVGNSFIQYFLLLPEGGAPGMGNLMVSQNIAVSLKVFS